MKTLLLVLSMISFSAFAADNNSKIKTEAKPVKSFSVENGYFELDGLTINKGSTPRPTVKALLNPTKEQAETLLLAKQNNWKVAMIYEPKSVEESKYCDGYSQYLYSKKDDNSLVRVCHVITPVEIIVN